MRNYRNPIYLWILLFTVARLCLIWLIPFDHTGDGWGYACDLLKGDFKNGHHLLFQYFQQFWYQLYIFLGGKTTHTIELLTSVNIVLSGIVLLVLNRISGILIPEITASKKLGLIGLVGLSMSFNRYSFENETYILPLLLILLSFLYWLKYLKSLSKNDFFMAIIMGCLAPLFHQTAIWGCLAIFIASIRFRKNLSLNYALLISIFIMVIGLWWLVYYLFATQIYEIRIVELLLQDVISGQVETSWDLKTLVFSMVNFIRTFIEFKGSTLILIKGDTLAQIILFTVLTVLIYLIRKIVFRQSVTHQWANELNMNIVPQILKKSEAKFQEGNFLLGFFILLYTAFAIFSQGNHEFMLPLACFVPLFLLGSRKFEFLYQNSTLLILLLWNGYFFYGANFKNQQLIQTWDKDELISNILVSQYSHQLSLNEIVLVTTEASRIYNYSEYNWLTTHHNFQYANSEKTNNNWIYRNIAIKFNLSDSLGSRKSIILSDLQQNQLNFNRANITYRQKNNEEGKQNVIAVERKGLESYQISVID